MLWKHFHLSDNIVQYDRWDLDKISFYFDIDPIFISHSLLMEIYEMAEFSKPCVGFTAKRFTTCRTTSRCT